MSFASDDLATVLVAPDQEFAGYGMGLLRSFDRDSFTNTVLYRGTELHNLPVKDRIGALTYQAGDVVQLAKWRPTGGGLGSYWIDSAPVIPGGGRAEQAIDFLRGQLAKQIAKEVLAEGISVALVAPHEFTTSTSYTDLPTPGPVVSDVEVSEAGVAIVFVSARVRAEQVGNGSTESFMSFAVSGATTLPAADVRSRTTFVRLSNEPGSFITDVAADAAASVPLLNLNPGLHTFTAKYRGVIDGGNTGFANRSLMVIAL